MHPDQINCFSLKCTQTECDSQTVAFPMVVPVFARFCLVEVLLFQKNKSVFENQRVVFITTVSFPTLGKKHPFHRRMLHINGITAKRALANKMDSVAHFVPPYPR